jgi:DNA-binding NtrC family response regulator
MACDSRYGFSHYVAGFAPKLILGSRRLRLFRRRRNGAMATIVLIGTDLSLLEGISQTLAAEGHRVTFSASVAESLAHGSSEQPLLAVVERSAALTNGDVLRLPLAPGGTLVLYRADGPAIPPLPAALQRLVVADLRLPLERQRLVALANHVEERIRSTGRDSTETTPTERRAL